jgi:hypothetical protein
MGFAALSAASRSSQIVLLSPLWNGFVGFLGVGNGRALRDRGDLTFNSIESSLLRTA